MRKILILEANPRHDLSLNDEIRDLQSVVNSSGDREEFRIDIGLSVRSTDLHHLMQKYEPNIVHFCGHGTGQDGLVFKDKNIDTDTISRLFALCREHLQCVVLNACYSEVQADEINKHIKYVIGMNQAIRDDAAIAFSIGFYRALGFGKSVENAFKWGKNAIQLALTDGSISRDRKKAEIDAKMRKLIPVEEAKEDIIIAEHLKPVLMINSDIVLPKPIDRVSPVNEFNKIEIEELEKDIASLTIDWQTLREDARNEMDNQRKRNFLVRADKISQTIIEKQEKLKSLID